MTERIIMHIDMNSYFASVEQQANPFLRGKPIGVTGKRQERSVVAAASIEAKKLGVKTAMSSWEAKKICPSIQIIMGDPEKYAEITHRFNAIFSEFADAVEQFSVDESFLDVTESAQDYLGATVMAQMIKTRLREECGERITCSVGVGPNKLVAKLASELEKPDGLIVVRPKDVTKLLDCVELTDFCGIGSRTAAHLERLGVTTVEQLRDFPLHLLVKEFKNYGFWLYDAARGRDDSPVVEGEEDPKSVGHSYTLPRDAWDAFEVKHYLLGLCDKVAWRLRRDSFAARGVTAYIRYGDFSGQAQQHRFREATADGLTLFRIAWGMIRLWLDPTKPVRLVGIAAGMLSKGPEQPGLFPKDQKLLSLTSALDAIQRRYGQNGWTRASLLRTSFKARASGFAYDHEL